MPISPSSVPKPMPRAVTPIRFSSGGLCEPGIPYHQRASYSRKPVGLTSGVVSKASVLGCSAASGLGNVVTATPVSLPYLPLEERGRRGKGKPLFAEDEATASDLKPLQAAEEGHAKKIDVEAIAGHHHGGDITHADIADANLGQHHRRRGGNAIGRRDAPAEVALGEMEAEAAGGPGRQRYRVRARVDHDAESLSVNRGIGEKVALRVGRDGDLVAGERADLCGRRRD